MRQGGANRSTDGAPVGRRVDLAVRGLAVAVACLMGWLALRQAVATLGEEQERSFNVMRRLHFER